MKTPILLVEDDVVFSKMLSRFLERNGYDVIGCYTLEEAEKYIEEKQFAPGSMLPKVQSCMEFVKNNTHGGTALITSLQKAKVALQGETGTIITK